MLGPVVELDIPTEITNGVSAGGGVESHFRFSDILQKGAVGLLREPLPRLCDQLSITSNHSCFETILEEVDNLRVSCIGSIETGATNETLDVGTFEYHAGPNKGV